jgi:hypothetical protein
MIVLVEQYAFRLAIAIVAIWLTVQVLVLGTLLEFLGSCTDIYNQSLEFSLLVEVEDHVQ